MTTAALELVDGLAAEGRAAVTTSEVRSRLSLSHKVLRTCSHALKATASSSVFQGASTSFTRSANVACPAATADRLDEAVAIAANGRVHRICYRSALHEHGLLSRPGRGIQLAVDRRLRIAGIGERELEATIERVEHIHIGRERRPIMDLDQGRALLDAAQQPRRVGGIAVVADALWTSDTNAADIASLAMELNLSVGLRRLASLNKQLELRRLDDLTLSTATHRRAPLDPDDPRTEGGTTVFAA